MRLAGRLGPWTLGAAAGLAALGLAGWLGARTHVRVVTGDATQAARPCWACHGTPRFTDLRRARRHPAPAFLAATPDGATLFASCGPTRSLAVIDVGTREVRDRVSLPGHPRGLAVAPDGGTLAVALQGEDAVALVSIPSLRVGEPIPVGVEPAGLAFAADGRHLFVANALSQDVSLVDVATRREMRRIGAGGREPFAVATSPDGRTVAVVSRMASLVAAEDEPQSELALLDAETGWVSARVALPSCHLAQGLAFTADGRRVIVPAVRVRNRLPIMQVARGWVMSSVLVSLDPATLDLAILPLDDPGAGFPDPTAIAMAADGERAFVAAGGSDEACIVDLSALRELEPQARPDAPERRSWTRRYVPHRFGTGDGPHALALVGPAAAPLLAVAERLDDAVGVYDMQGVRVARLGLGAGKKDDAIHRGERVFHDASYAFQHSFSCRSCHPDGHTDGLTYDFDVDGIGRNILLNRSLRGLRDTAPFKWNGSNPTLQRQCGPRFAKVLTRSDPFPDARLADLVAYLESLPAPRPDPGAGRVGGAEAGAVARGRDVFFRTSRKDGQPIPPRGRCVTCHPPPHYTSRRPADVGTLTARDDAKTLDTPHLTGIGAKAPYLHDGRALTLEEIWTQPGVGDTHGTVTDLAKSDLNDLVEFLRSL